MKFRTLYAVILLAAIFLNAPAALAQGNSNHNNNNGSNGNNGYNANNNNGNTNNNGNNGNNGNHGNDWNWSDAGIAWHHQHGDHQYCNHGNHRTAPFDGGFTLLAAAGLAYGIKRARNNRKKTIIA